MFKKISDELWFAVLFILIAIWMYFLNNDFIIISGLFSFVGIMLLIVDNLQKVNNKDFKTRHK